MCVYHAVFIHAMALPVQNNINNSILSLLRNVDAIGNPFPVDTSDTTAVEDCSNSVLSCLLQESNSDVNCKDDYDSTPLHYAAAKGNHSSVDELIRYGKADVNVSVLHLFVEW